MLNPNANYAVSDRIQGIDMDRMYVGYFNYWDWTVTA